MDSRHLLAEQVAYYRARAGEYDEWFLRQGRYDRGPEHRAEWAGEVARLEAALASSDPRGTILELACGTGLWTAQLSEAADRLVAVDSSPEMIELNRRRVRSAKVEYLVADVFSWTPRETFDFVFFSFWLSHVPEPRFDGFWALVRRALKPNGKVFFIDSLRESTSTARDHGPPADSGTVRRLLNDGREFQVVKIFHNPVSLERRLHDQCWHGSVRRTGKFFFFGLVTQGAG